MVTAGVGMDGQCSNSASAEHHRDARAGRFGGFQVDLLLRQNLHHLGMNDSMEVVCAAPNTQADKK